MKTRKLVLAAALALLPLSQAAASSWSLGWTGGAGYTMTGTFSITDGLVGAATAADVTAMQIFGFQNGGAVGSWNLADGFAGFNFNFNFNTATGLFGQGGDSSGPEGQEWNTGGGGASCGVTAFGFASGSALQGVCVNNGGFTGGTNIYNLTATRLDTTVVPVPASALLLASGLGLLGFMRRRAAA